MVEPVEVKLHVTLYVEVPEGECVEGLCETLDNLTIEEIMDQYSVMKGDGHWEENV